MNARKKLVGLLSVLFFLGVFFFISPTTVFAQGFCSWDECAEIVIDDCDTEYVAEVGNFIGYAWCPAETKLKKDYSCECIPEETPTPPPLLEVDLTVDPFFGVSPLDVDLTASVSGTEPGTINYSFWWDCNDPTTDVEEAYDVCGPLSTPDPGSCKVTIGLGYKCDGVSTNPLEVNNVYFVDRIYTPKVIVERGLAPPVEDRETVVVSSNLRPSVSDVSGMAPFTLCDTPLGVLISWTYDDPEDDPQLKFQIQADDNEDFDSPEYDSGEITSAATLHFVDDPDFDYDETQYARVKVWDDQGNWSDWSPHTDWRTPLYPPPNLSVGWSPNPAVLDEEVLFVNHSTYDVTPTWLWNFGCKITECRIPGSTDPVSVVNEFYELPEDVPPFPQDYYDLTLRASDGLYICNLEDKIYVDSEGESIPIWYEVGP